MIRSTAFTALSAMVLLASLLINTTAHAQSNHYRWTNQDGKIVYSDRPPPSGVDYEIVSSTSSYSRKVTASEGALKASEGQIAPDAAAAQAELNRIEAAAKACSAARANLEALAGEAKIVVRTPEGGQRELSAEEIEMQRQTARSQVEAYCP